jgi:hypothetical protein
MNMLSLTKGEWASRNDSLFYGLAPMPALNRFSQGLNKDSNYVWFCLKACWYGFYTTILNTWFTFYTKKLKYLGIPLDI